MEKKRVGSSTSSTSTSTQHHQHQQHQQQPGQKTRGGGRQDNKHKKAQEKERMASHKLSSSVMSASRRHPEVGAALALLRLILACALATPEAREHMREGQETGRRRRHSKDAGAPCKPPLRAKPLSAR
eukprot:CAMPEP_0118980336 /NCGR_PEP_ID=MMETSP1173-20130426/28072_1 /TAXON_ID=1034831 /ORGANISM="Rhizochromulina marina cf, Strain CCMP1243" /LENGTH=127 /DNA_ID=CAMNT_0006930673 /DNA_START=125 /DNA_END=509 /DNA_ORIENTATION=-